MSEHFEYRPLSELSWDVDPTANDMKYSYGTDVFGRSNDWVIVENNTNPVKVYKLPPYVSRILNHLVKVRFDAGRSDAQEQIRRALGLE